MFGAAAILHAVARLTADVDVTIDLGKRSAGELVAALAAAGFELRIADAAGFVEATRVPSQPVMGVIVEPDRERHFLVVVTTYPVWDHFRALPARDRATILAAISRQLLHEPLKETRNRKPFRPNPIAPWELRVGQLRVFYDVVAAEGGVVRILA
ncbi:MAG: hypothetical protein ACREM3_15715 [Candidatus Rokuibacteriota bacterium]